MKGRGVVYGDVYTTTPVPQVHSVADLPGRTVMFVSRPHCLGGLNNWASVRPSLLPGQLEAILRVRGRIP